MIKKGLIKITQIPITGRVVEEQKNYFVVDTPEGSLLATTSGTLKKQRKKPCSGDIVAVTIIDAETRRGQITVIEKRTPAQP